MTFTFSDLDVLGVSDGWIEERLYTMIVFYDNNQIIMHWAAWWQLSIIEKQPLGKPTVINLVYAFVYCICVCMCVWSVGVGSDGMMPSTTCQHFLWNILQKKTHVGIHKDSTHMQRIDKDLEQWTCVLKHNIVNNARAANACEKL